MKNKRFEVVAAQSNIAWAGRKLTGAHNGIIAIKEGTFVFDEDELTGGKFIIDTTSIKILDVVDPVTNAQFAGHLASDDFFASEQYPEAWFGISSVEPTENHTYNITGDLTIKGITHPVMFNAMINFSDELLTASGKIIIDRTRYGMKFQSGSFFKNLGDALIHDEFQLNVSITAEAVWELTTAA